MKKTTLDKDIEFMGKRCFPLETKSCKEFGKHLRRIAQKHGLKCREDEKIIIPKKYR